jgi:predicted permease
MDVGIETAHLLTTSLQLPDRKYPSIEQRLAFYERLEERLRANPQFASVSVASNIPMFGAFARQLRIEGKEQRDGEQVPNVSMVTVDPHYFQTLGVTLARGRGFTAQDGAAGQENAIINQRFAQMHFANEDPIGRRITLSIDLQGGPPPGQGIPLQLTVTIVGIAPNVRQGPQAEPAPIAYLPYRIDPRGTMNLIARTSGDPLAMAPALREEVRAVDADLPLFNIRSLDQQLEQQRWPFKVFGTMFGVFAFIALMLSAVGLYAVTAYQVAQRTSEIGVRMALGAQSPQVLKLFLRRGLIQLTIGLVLGVAAAFGVGAIFQAGGILVQVSPRDPWTIGSIATILAVVGLAACVWPARRATRLDPVLALRRD